ncbi:hypothetical protein FNF27_01687 [Cafeteria roenbergensis]|uniref:Peptidase A1 domain-containing protein n=1 Tax=Cafeteria roenbergensis TaxID=33653 RepID=A0A5A8E738_CAFRO|nr:hypothetical protein FNF31_00721 [Cafeteria roenbergensis]KAA0171671.1 hypothetical protein FNF28_00604 [Cafeteria roenbergensis]KAA0176865.1 hypothetical protein FNF27_01687 [Cafeteria roenbergensis]
MRALGATVALWAVGTCHCAAAIPAGRGATLPLVRVQHHACFADSSTRPLGSGPRSIPVINQENLALLSEFQLGTPGQTTLLQLDTGSTVAWTVNESVAQAYGHRGFALDKSSSGKSLGYAVELGYGSGSLEVAVVRDSLSWSPAPDFAASTSAQFGVTVNGGGWVANGWSNFVNDGIFGLGMRGLCEWQDCDTLAWQSLFSSAGYAPVFSLLTTPKLDPVPYAAQVSPALRALIDRLDALSAGTSSPGGGQSAGDSCGGLRVSTHDQSGVASANDATASASASYGQLLASWSLEEAQAAGTHRPQLEAAARVPGVMLASAPRQSAITIGGLNGSHAASGAELFTIPLLPSTDSGGFGYYWADLRAVTLYATGSVPVKGLSAPSSGVPAAAAASRAQQGQPLRRHQQHQQQEHPASLGSGGGAAKWPGPTEQWCASGDDNVCKALFDSGTSFLAVRDDVFAALTSAVNAAANGTCRSFAQGAEIVCTRSLVNFAALPNVSFAFGVGARSSIAAGTMMTPPLAAGGADTFEFVLPGSALLDCANYGNLCRMTIMAIPPSVGSLHFILGDTFLRAYVAMFDAEHASVSLARSIAMPEPVPRPSLNRTDVLAIVLIVLGSLVGVVALVLVAGCLIVRRRRQRREEAFQVLALMDRTGAAGEMDTDSFDAVMIEGEYVQLTA